MRFRRIALLVCCLSALVAAAPEVEVVHLKNGGVLRGKVLEQDDQRVVVAVGAGKVTLPRSAVDRIESDTGAQAEEPPVAKRDEWFLLLRDERVVGWRRLVHTSGPEREQVEERQVILVPRDGEETLDCRRVEIADREGEPLEFLLMKTRGKQTSVVSGNVHHGEVTVRVRRDRESRREVIPLEPGWRLMLPRWSAFQLGAAPQQSTSYRVLDPETLAITDLRMARLDDRAFAGSAGVRPCRSFERRVGTQTLRTLFEPAEGALALQWGEDRLRAVRVHRDRVELLQRQHAPEPPIGIDEALLYPFVAPRPQLEHFHPRTGLALETPSVYWVEEREEVPEGLVLSYENDRLLASLDIFVHPLPTATASVEDCFERGLARLELVTKAVEPDGPLNRGRISDWPARMRRYTAEHRGEKLGCMLVVVRAPDRYVVLVSAAAASTWPAAEKQVNDILDNLEITR